MTQKELLKKLSECHRFRSDLSPMNELMRLLGNPEKDMRFVHIGGTNGKGSTSTMVSKILTKQGYKTGLFTSPYIVDFRERMQCDGEMISESDLCKIGEAVLEKVHVLEKKNVFVTEFDIVTAIAFVWFAELKCDFVVLEVGLGGKLDSTNTVPDESVLVSAITSISLDHVGVLGDTEEAIAAEKAGIFKENGRAVVSGAIAQNALDVIRQKASEKNCKLTVTDGRVRLLEQLPYGLKMQYENISFLLPMTGLYQVQNCDTALCIIEQLRKLGIAISDSSIVEGMECASFPARMELVVKKPLFYIDGAHNPEGARALCETLSSIAVKGKRVCINGMMSDKSVDEVVGTFSKCFDYVITLTPSNPRSLSGEKLAKIWRSFGIEATPVNSTKKAVRFAVKQAGEDGLVVCCGSLYLCSEVRAIIK